METALHVKNVIETQALRHTYGPGSAALRGISLEVKPGEIFGLLGPNGSGKSTLFRILSTLFPPSSGKAFIAGLDLAGQFREARKKLGVVFQSPSVDAKLTVWENLKFQGYIYGLSGKRLRERCEAMLEHLGLGARRRHLAGTLSGGLKRRLELAKGLLHEPEVLLLDEPSTGLDPGARMDLWQYLKKLRGDAGVTVLMTTHLMEEAEHCDRIAIMNEGVIVRTGTPAELKTEVGGDVLVVYASDAQGLADKIWDDFGIQSMVLDGSLQIEHEKGARFIRELVEAFPGMIESVTFRKPTLEDVFVHYTGHRFWHEPAASPKERIL